MKKEDKVYIWDIIDHGKRALNYVLGISQAQFRADDLKISAVKI
jgi:uncharacterized protein with HEPN domain